MNKRLVLALLVLSACGGKQKKETPKEESRYFDIRHYITTDLNDIKNTPYYIYKIDVVNGKQDSSAIGPAEAIAFAEGFLHPDINNPEIKSSYKENIFEDKTMNTFTISYTSEDKELPIQNVDVILKEDGKTVKRLFIRKFFRNSDTTSMEQWSWKPGQSFEVNRLQTPRNQPEISHRTLIVWNEKK